MKKSIFFDSWGWIAVVSEFKITKVFTGDEHFEKVNLGFKRVPTD